MGSEELQLWSIWFWIGTSCSELVYNTDTTLFKSVDPSNQSNGIVLAIGRVTACSCALFSSRFGGILERRASVIVLSSAGIAGALLLIASRGYSIHVTHFCIVAFYAVQELSFCAASSQIAIRTNESLRLMLLFANTFVALIIQVSIQVALGPWIFNLNVRSKFACLAALMFTLAAGMSIVHARTLVNRFPKPTTTFIEI
uniref:Major facilitator superfamily (MFS) profile domain-containing protein n=2 Tax=Spongospora subterranea TaxID=70186 RepID=A0A0H5QG28_9EUKA|eukprot:CRZ00905.1 hypothetical protein [Spongospora subterranea]